MTPEQRQIEKAIKQESPGLLNNLPGQKKQQLIDFLQNAAGSSAGSVIQHTSQVTHHTSYPVPPSDLLEGYNRVLPDGANRLFALVERQSAHRQDIERSIVTTQNRATVRGQWIALAIVIFLAIAGTFLAYVGQAGVAATIFATTIAGAASMFIAGRRSQEKSLTKKAP